MSEPDLGLVPTTETEPLYPRKPPTIKPLSDDELSTLESHLRVPLPSAYREFVQQVAKCSSLRSLSRSLLLYMYGSVCLLACLAGWTTMPPPLGR